MPRTEKSLYFEVKNIRNAYGLYRTLIPTFCAIFTPGKILFPEKLIVWYMTSNKFQEINLP